MGRFPGFPLMCEVLVASSFETSIPRDICPAVPLLRARARMPTGSAALSGTRSMGISCRDRSFSAAFATNPPRPKGCELAMPDFGSGGQMARIHGAGVRNGKTGRRGIRRMYGIIELQFERSVCNLYGERPRRGLAIGGGRMGRSRPAGLPVSRPIAGASCPGLSSWCTHCPSEQSRGVAGRGRYAPKEPAGADPGSSPAPWLKPPSIPGGLQSSRFLFVASLPRGKNSSACPKFIHAETIDVHHANHEPSH